MKLGLICDIHEPVEHLQQALDHFAACSVDRIVVLGDLFEMGERIEKWCQRLAAAGVVGVWGNHDHGFCVDPDAETRAKYPSVVLDYMATLQPRIEIDGCYFAHAEPWLNPQDVLDMSYYEGPPDEPERIHSFQPIVFTRSRWPDCLSPETSLTTASQWPP